MREAEQGVVGAGVIGDEHERGPGCGGRRDPTGDRQVGEFVRGHVGQLRTPVPHRRQHDERHQDDPDRPGGPRTMDPVTDPHETEAGEDREAEREREDPVRRIQAGQYADRRRQAQIRARHALQAIAAGLEARRLTPAAQAEAMGSIVHAAELQLPEAWLPYVVSR